MFLLLFVFLFLPFVDDVAAQQPAPQFKIKSLDGTQFDLAKMRGQVVVLNLWSVGCAPCRKEIPALNKIVSEFKDMNVAFIAPAYDGPKSLKEFLKSNDFDYHIVADPEGEISELFDASAYPTHIIIDQHGIINSILVGDYETSVEELRQKVKKLLQPGQ